MAHTGKFNASVFDNSLDDMRSLRVDKNQKSDNMHSKLIPNSKLGIDPNKSPEISEGLSQNPQLLGA